MSFFTSCPLTGGLGVPLQTVRTSNSSLSSRAFVRVRRFEAAYRLVFVRRPGVKFLEYRTMAILFLCLAIQTHVLQARSGPGAW